MDFHSDHVAGDCMVRSHLHQLQGNRQEPACCTCDGTMETLTLGASSPPISMQQSRSPTMLACLAIVGIRFCAKPFVGRRGKMCWKNNLGQFGPCILGGLGMVYSKPAVKATIFSPSSPALQTSVGLLLFKENEIYDAKETGLTCE